MIEDGISRFDIAYRKLLGRTSFVIAHRLSTIRHSWSAGSNRFSPRKDHASHLSPLGGHFGRQVESEQFQNRLETQNLFVSFANFRSNS